MATGNAFDVIVVGGGIAGSTFAGVLARAGLGVLLVEKEPGFRDRIRGETTWPYGVADIKQLNLWDVLQEAGSVNLPGFRRYADRTPGEPYYWETDSIDQLPEIGFPHPQLQEVAFMWAGSHGATTVRPAKGTSFSRNGSAEVTVAHEGTQETFSARLVVGADGKLSATRRWTGGETVADLEHHRFGGVLVAGVATQDRDTDNVASTPGVAVNWFAQSVDHTRLYIHASAAILHETGADRSFDQLIAFAAAYMPEGALDNVEQVGPIGFFANSNIWASEIAGNDVVLIGDAAGAPDPSQGHGTALLFHDVRTLSELLLNERDWTAAAAEFARKRRAYYEPVLAYDRWENLLSAEPGPEADRLREGHERAKEQDPTLGGFAMIEARGPDGLVADEAARRLYFGEA